MRARLSPWPVVLVLSLVVFASPGLTAQVASDEAYQYFELNCQSCHTIGGGALAGPDLKNVGERREQDWLVAFLRSPKAVIDSGDPTAAGLLRDARGVIMPDPPGMTDTLAEKVLTVIQVESGLEKSRFSGLQISDRPLTAEDVAMGRALFRGEQAFLSGAPSCFSCHDLEGAGGFGGGRLGPDLTAVYARLEGRKALAAWLSSPPSEVMAPVYRQTPLDPDEVLALTAYLKHAAESGVEEADSGILAFMLTGFGLAAVLLVLLDLVWRDRYVATRQPLVRKRLVSRRALEGPST